MANKRSILIISFVSHRTLNDSYAEDSKIIVSLFGFIIYFYFFFCVCRETNETTRNFRNIQKKWQFVLKNELNTKRKQSDDDGNDDMLMTMKKKKQQPFLKSDSCCVLWLVCFHDVLLMASSIIQRVLWPVRMKCFSAGSMCWKVLWKIIKWINLLGTWINSRVLNWSKCLFILESVLNGVQTHTHTCSISLHESMQQPREYFIGSTMDAIRSLTLSALLIMTRRLYSVNFFFSSSFN